MLWFIWSEAVFVSKRQASQQSDVACCTRTDITQPKCVQSVKAGMSHADGFHSGSNHSSDSSARAWTHGENKSVFAYAFLIMMMSPDF